MEACTESDREGRQGKWKGREKVSSWHAGGDEGFDELYFVKNDGQAMTVEKWRESE